MKGKIEKNGDGWDMPVHAPYYGNLPYYYKEAKWLAFDYYSDPESISKLLPRQIEIPEKPHVSLVFGDYPFSTVGSYKEALQFVKCSYKGDDYVYPIHLFLDTSVGVSAGREIVGFPKKFGNISFTSQEDIIAAKAERPIGFPIATGMMRAEQPGPMPPDGTILKIINWRLIPSPDGDVSKPSLSQLTEMDAVQHPKELWIGTGCCGYPSASVFDPWHLLPVIEFIGCMYFIFDLELLKSKILEDI